MAILIALIFSKYFYLASLTSYYTFYLIAKFHVSVQNAQVHLFIFLGAVAAGTIVGGPMGDRIGPQVRDLVLDPRRAAVHADRCPTRICSGPDILTVIIGLMLASAFSAILVYAQELMPGQSGIDLRAILRTRLRHGRHRRRAAG